jgi:asparagine synthase (glutamine-hydrolysing)
VSAILAVIGPVPPDAHITRRMLSAMDRRGSDRLQVSESDGATLAVARNAWEMEAAFSGGVLTLSDGPLIVAADATLYYLQDLRRALSREGVQVAGPTASHHILAAYRAWGKDCARHLEGDFAFVLWDASRQLALCARDFAGKRPLFYAGLGSTLVLASTIEGVVKHAACSDEINLTALAQAAAGLFAATGETVYRSVRRLQAGRSLRWQDGSRLEMQNWSPPPISESAADQPFDEAAFELRRLLCNAVSERLDPAGPTSVWMSGGWDSPAVFAAGESLVRSRNSPDHLRPISISYPLGDPGREDELIKQIADFWNARVHWIDIGDIPFLDQPAERARSRSEPFAHAYETWNRALAGGSRAAGSRVALDGQGGDPLFQVSPIYLADLFRSGRWWSVAREWRQQGLGGSGWRSFFHWCVHPALPSAATRLLVRARGGRPLRGYLDRWLPAWIDMDFAVQNGLMEREVANTPAKGSESCASYESRYYLTHPYFPLISAHLSAFALEAGVELRSPLYDRRIIDFAMRRPRWERASGRETKRLLRRAMAGLLPPEVLAPRQARTGVTGAYFDRSMRGDYRGLLSRVLERPLLANYGIVNADTLQTWVARYLRSGGDELGVRLFFTFQAELWLRERSLQSRNASLSDRRRERNTSDTAATATG